MKERVLVALSGGVDSSTVAVMLKEQGYDIVGVTFKTHIPSNRNSMFEKGLKDAKKLANKLNIPYYIIDVSEEFNEKVIKYFIKEYEQGRTPNPCVFCNHEIKWTKLIEVSDALKCKYVATGHYAKVNNTKGRCYISASNDHIKDQCFFLWKLTQSQLKRTIFPLGNRKKTEIKNIAKGKGLKSIVDKSESYNVCFIPTKDYREFLNKYLSQNIGSVVLENGKEIDKHKGIWNFTIGQKKGFKNIESNLCVLKLNADKNEVVVGELKNTFVNEIMIQNLNFHKYQSFDEQKVYLAKINYKGELVETKVRKFFKGYQLILENPVMALASGQSVSLFENNDLVAGGEVV